MINPLVILLLIPVSVWWLGLFIYTLDSFSGYLFTLLFFQTLLLLFLLLVLFFIKPVKGRQSLSVYVTQLKGDFVRYAIKSSLLILLFSSFYMLISFIFLISQVSFDDARFLIRELPFTGFLSRINYWWPIALAPFIALYSTLKLYSKMKVFLIFLILVLAEFSSGSKAGVVWLFLTFYLTNIYFQLFFYGKSRQTFTTIGFYLVISLSLPLTLFYAFGDGTLESAFSGFAHRLTYGAIEGIFFVKEYVEGYGTSFPHFSIERPLILLFTTLRIFDKDYLTVDSGVYLARMFGRENDNASYTFSWLGLGYLELGYWGVVALFMILVVVIFLFFVAFSKLKSPIWIAFNVPFIVVCAHFLDWGWVDGIIVFATLYVITLFMIFAFFKLIEETKFWLPKH